jgi:hypothetical protein
MSGIYELIEFPDNGDFFITICYSYIISTLIWSYEEALVVVGVTYVICFLFIIRLRLFKIVMSLNKMTTSMYIYIYIYMYIYIYKRSE